MTQKQENLSAFVDGEVQDENIVSSLVDDAEMAEKWQRYHLIRQGLRKELPKQANFDVSGAIASALESEPTILAPRKTWRDAPIVSNVIPLVRSGGQLAIAASVAVAMVIGVQKLNQEEQQIFNPAPAVVPGIQGGLSPVSLEQTQPLPRTDVREQQRRISAYLNDHRKQVLLKDSQRFLPTGESTDEVDAAGSELGQERENFPE